MGETLDLDAIFERDTVKIRGDNYELRNAQEFGILEDHRMRTLVDRIGKLEDGKVKTEEEAEQASKLIHELAGMLVVDCPDDIPDWACSAIFRFWTTRATSGQPDGVGDPPKPRRQTTAASSRGSKRSTAATRTRGSTGRRGS